MNIEIGQNGDGFWYAKICEDGDPIGPHCRRFPCAGFNVYADDGRWYAALDYITYHDNASVLTYGDTLGIALQNMLTQLDRTKTTLNASANRQEDHD
jgi:hypothetical protein